MMFGEFAAEPTRLSTFVRPFVGTQGEGNTYPGPSAPFGMIQLGPDTEKELWETASGYEYSDPTILGFSLTHLTGTGIPDLGDFLFIPQVGEPKLVPGAKNEPETGYQSRYSHEEETASAGYYKVNLQKSGVTVELTAGERAGMTRMTFPASDNASILTDLSPRAHGQEMEGDLVACPRRRSFHDHGISPGKWLGEGTTSLLCGALLAAIR
jgi:putative alpha-1,2-mannosidase